MMGGWEGDGEENMGGVRMGRSEVDKTLGGWGCENRENDLGGLEWVGQIWVGLVFFFVQKFTCHLVTCRLFFY